MTRLLLVGVVAGVVLSAEPSLADEGVTPGASWFDATAEVSRGASESGGNPPANTAVSLPNGGEPAAVAYSQRLACGDVNGNLATDSGGCDSSLIRCGAGDRSFLYYTVATYQDGDTQTSLPQCLEPSETSNSVLVEAAPARVTEAMVQRAFERVPLPESEVVVQPPGGQTLVGLETIFSTEAEGFTETVTLLGRSVELDITPTSYEWSHGDDTGQTTDWPGRRWSRAASEYVSHVYEDRMRVSTSVDTTWSARYRVGDSGWQDVPGTVTIEGEALPLRVRSATPRLVAASGVSQGR